MPDSRYDRALASWAKLAAEVQYQADTCGNPVAANFLRGEVVVFRRGLIRVQIDTWSAENTGLGWDATLTTAELNADRLIAEAYRAVALTKRGAAA